MALWVAVISTFCAVAVATGVGSWMVLRGHAPVRRRLRDLVRAPERPFAAVVAADGPPPAFAMRLANVVPRSRGRLREMRTRLALAGFRSSHAPVLFFAWQSAAAAACAALFFAIGGMAHLGLTPIGAVIGALAADLWVVARARERASKIRQAMPDGLDLLAICMESGCSLDQALVKCGDELHLAHPELAEELALITHEIRAGQARTDAFRRFGARTGLDEARSLASILTQTDRYGTSVVSALKMHADLCRTRRRQHAEERAAKAGVKLVFPLVFCLFPAFYAIALGPTLIQFARVFFTVVQGD